MRAVQLQTAFFCKEQVLTSSCYFYFGWPVGYVGKNPEQVLNGIFFGQFKPVYKLPASGEPFISKHATYLEL